MIDHLEDMEPGALFTQDGKDVWEVLYFYTLPTITLRNIRTSETISGAIGCLNLKPFVPLKPTAPLQTDVSLGE